MKNKTTFISYLNSVKLYFALAFTVFVIKSLVSRSLPDPNLIRELIACYFSEQEHFPQVNLSLSL